MLITHYNFSELNIKNVVHVGANIGEELDFYDSLGVKKIYFFEPRPEALLHLNENCNKFRKNIDIAIFPIGLGSEKTEKYLHAGGQSSSFLEPKLHLQYYPGIQFLSGATFSIRRGDQVLPENIDIDMLNIDVQGFELEVLKGMGNLLNKTKLIYTEINTDELYKDCPVLSDIDAYLYAYRFKRVECVVCDAKWGDAIYIKR